MTTPVPPEAQLTNGTKELTEIDRIMRLQILTSEYDVLNACRPPVRTFVDALKRAIDAKADTAAPVTAFASWKTNDGALLWENYRDIKKKYPDPAVTRPIASSGPVVWSETCDTVWDDMHKRFDNWRSGTATNRGHWWGGPANGGTGAGAMKVPDAVVVELGKRIGDRPGNIVPTAWWRLQDSLSGGLAFHRTSRSEDFIYHLTL